MAVLLIFSTIDTETPGNENDSTTMIALCK